MQNDSLPNGFNEDLNTEVKLPSDFFERLNQNKPDLGVVLLLLKTLEIIGKFGKNEWMIKEAIFQESAREQVFGGNPDQFMQALTAALNLGFLIKYTDQSKPEEIYYLPSLPKTRLLIEDLQLGRVKLDANIIISQIPIKTRSNIFQVYEANIGPITPMIADILKEDAQIYPPEWIIEAVGEAVERNIRNWKYVRAILTNWKEKGRGTKDKEDGSDLEKFRELYKSHQR